jgi:cytochrome c-type biogenesis protein CcmH/NrfG
VRENIPPVQKVSGKGLPPRVYVPILIAMMCAFLGVVGYFLRIGLGTTGAALGPAVSGGQGEAGPAGVGGGTPVPANAGGPPAPVERLLVELRGRLQKNPKDLSALKSVAALYYDAGKYQQAIPYFERALALDPADRATRADYDDARAALKRASP